MQCDAAVYRRDTYRYSGRGGSGFEMHYEQGQCKRAASVGPLCWQHAERPSVLRWSSLWSWKRPPAADAVDPVAAK